MNTTLKSNFPPTKKINRKKKLKVCTQKKKKRKQKTQKSQHNAENKKQIWRTDSSELQNLL